MENPFWLFHPFPYFKTFYCTAVNNMLTKHFVFHFRCFNIWLFTGFVSQNKNDNSNFLISMIPSVCLKTLFCIIILQNMKKNLDNSKILSLYIALVQKSNLKNIHSKTDTITNTYTFLIFYYWMTTKKCQYTELPNIILFRYLEFRCIYEWITVEHLLKFKNTF